MKRLIKARVISEQDTCRFIFQTPTNCGWLKLMEDSYSLNISVTKSLSSKLKKATRDAVLAPAKNRLIRELFHEDYKDQDVDHAEYFVDQEHIFPRMAREFSDHMLTGEYRRISGMVETTKTVIKTAMSSGTLALIDVEGILRHEDKQLRQFFSIFQQRKEEFLNLSISITCSLKLAEQARAFSWFHLTGRRPTNRFL